MDNITENTQYNNAQGFMADALPSFSKNDLSDVSESITAVLRAAGFKGDHTRTILVSLAEANGRTTEFSAYFASLGSRMKNKLDPFAKDEELKRQGKANGQRWRRALEKLEEDQNRTGLYFVKCKRGGSNRAGHNYASKMTVDIDTFANTIRIARNREDFNKSRKYAFEEAARSVLRPMDKDKRIGRFQAKEMTDEEKRRRLEKTLVNSARGLAKSAKTQGLDLKALQDLVLEKIRLAFHQEEGSQIETPPAIDEVDTLLELEVSNLREETNKPPVLDDEKEEKRDTRGGLDTALYTLDAFESVGASLYEITLRDEVKKRAAEYKTLDGLSLRKNLQGFVERTERKLESLIIRPRGGSVIQLDDCPAGVAKYLEPYAFLIFETSPDNYQTWLAFPNETSEEELKAVRLRLLAALKETGSNGGAFGAMRWPGSINRKPSRNNFRVRLRQIKISAYCTAAELEAAGLLAPLASEPAKVQSFRSPLSNKIFPSYDRCLIEKGGDRSKADASFLKLCDLRGFSMNEATAELEIVSERAREERARGRKDYVRRTWKYVTAH
jgi:hypothetical protein